MMIDESLPQSFFSRNAKYRSAYSSAAAQWHNELRGTLKIDRLHKAAPDEEVEVVSSDSETNSEDGEVDEKAEHAIIPLGDENNFDDGDEDGKGLLESENHEELKIDHRPENGNNKPLDRHEIDFDSFENTFWPKAMKRHHNFSQPPSMVWSEIMSRIKGIII